jgi:hypothetical protein
MPTSPSVASPPLGEWLFPYLQLSPGPATVTQIEKAYKGTGGKPKKGAVKAALDELLTDGKLFLCQQRCHPRTPWEEGREEESGPPLRDGPI